MTEEKIKSRFVSTTQGTNVIGKLSNKELLDLNTQKDINYKDFLGENILIAHDSTTYGGAKIMKLVDVIEPDYNDWDKLYYKFIDDNKTIYLAKSEIYQFIPQKWLDDEEHEYYYVIFRYGKTERSKEHVYISNDFSIKVGDKVLPFGNEKTGNVIRTGFYKKSNAPHPVENTWLISRKAYAEIDASKYEDFNKYVDSNNSYYKYLLKRGENKNYIAKSQETYDTFSWVYIDHVYKYMMPNQDRKLDGKNVLDFLVGEFEGGYYYSSYEGDFLMRYNQLYTFFDSVWMSYLLAKIDYIEKSVIVVYKYMLCIYNNGGFDEFLLDVKYDKKCLDEHIAFINDFIELKL